MKTGFRGTFVISWAQTEIDGLDSAPLHALRVGAAWAWRGDATRVDGPTEILQLDRAEGSDILRKRAARMVHRLIGAAVEQKPFVLADDDDAPLLDNNFVVTDGAQSYTVTLISVGKKAPPLLMFLDEIPPRNSELWVVKHTLGLEAARPKEQSDGGVICFAQGTRIKTPRGPRLIEDLREGDKVLTKDKGAQEILWKGSRRMSGARLFAMPHLRPVRFSAGALGVDRPDGDLLVSPNHRMLIKGIAAQALFNTSEVLVAAKDLINGTTIAVDRAVRDVTYVHLLLEDHQVLWANGIESESFHPANASMPMLRDQDRARLFAQLPRLEEDPLIYGNYARRNLSASEAAILSHAA